MKHTPTPWHVRVLPAHDDMFFIEAPMPNDHPYFGACPYIEIMSDEDYPTKRADADLIVRAVNSHEALVAAAKAVLLSAGWPKGSSRLIHGEAKLGVYLTSAELNALESAIRIAEEGE